MKVIRHHAFILGGNPPPNAPKKDTGRTTNIVSCISLEGTNIRVFHLCVQPRSTRANEIAEWTDALTWADPWRRRQSTLHCVRRDNAPTTVPDAIHSDWWISQPCAQTYGGRCDMGQKT
jgi:hypothetical protein